MFHHAAWIRGKRCSVPVHAIVACGGKKNVVHKGPHFYDSR
jgi:hypothetical protein